MPFAFASTNASSVLVRYAHAPGVLGYFEKPPGIEGMNGCCEGYLTIFYIPVVAMDDYK